MTENVSQRAALNSTAEIAANVTRRANVFSFTDGQLVTGETGLGLRST